ncbi:MAG: hypothetical protein KY397_00520 [Gemmatimonadetes bacterium]|nr:hypothetical protein [Gemmatimonadota bacterium]
MTRATGDRAALWLPLLRSVTERFPRWSVWKNVESALTGHGDVDSFAPASDWPGVERTWIEWLREHGLGPAVVCRHVPQGPHFVALDPASPYLIQFDVKLLATFRGCALMGVDELLAMSEMDALGFRRIRPGAEGVLKLVYNGMRAGGRKDPEGLATKNVVELLESDPTGVGQAAELFGVAGAAVRRAADAVVDGRWDRPSLMAVEAWAHARAIATPKVALGRVWFNRVSKKRCPVLQVIREHDRRLPEDRAAWLDRVARVESHRMILP